MDNLIFCFSIAFIVLGIYHSLRTTSAHDLNQAALLPFADDPEAAKKITETTGIIFEKIAEGKECSNNVQLRQSGSMFTA